MRVGSKSRSLLRVLANGEQLDQVAITPWGGFALQPYVVVTLDNIQQERWNIQPIDFMTAAIQSLVEPLRWLASSDFKPAWNPGGQPKGRE